MWTPTTRRQHSRNGLRYETAPSRFAFATAPGISSGARTSITSIWRPNWETIGTSSDMRSRADSFMGLVSAATRCAFGRSSFIISKLFAL